MTDIAYSPDVQIVNEDGANNPLQLGLTIANIAAQNKTNASVTSLQNRNINTTSPLTGGGNLSADRTLSISGYSGTITTAKLTPGGANGSMTFTNGVLTAQTAAT